MMPEYPNRDAFEGIILHSGIYIDANDWKEKRGVVIGTANNARDVADGMVAAELSEVTMVRKIQILYDVQNRLLGFEH